MMYTNIFKGLSERAQMLLSREEGGDMDFKRSVSSFKADDIVAFANSKSGGTLMLGIDEVSNDRGRQIGKIVGCKIDDEAKMTILNRANSCIPPIDIEIFVENDDDIPFYRVEIPSGKNKPYCTSGGTYKIRDDGQNKTLEPTLLLELFLQQESDTFVNRFQTATSELDSILKVTHNLVHNHRKDLEKEMKKLKNKILAISEESKDALNISKDASLYSEKNYNLLMELMEKMNSFQSE